MKSFFVLCFTIGNAEIVLEMIDRFFDIYTDFIGFIPFFETTFDTRISTKIFFGINVNHSSAGRSGTWIITVANTTLGFVIVGGVIFPFHFWTYKFHGRKLAFQVRFASFPFHGKRWIMGTAGNAILVGCVAVLFNGKLYSKRNESLLESDFSQKEFCRFQLYRRRHLREKFLAQ